MPKQDYALDEEITEERCVHCGQCEWRQCVLQQSWCTSCPILKSLVKIAAGNDTKNEPFRLI